MRTIHRFIPAGPKHGHKTACGIPLATVIGGVDTDKAGLGRIEHAELWNVGDHGDVCVTGKGQPFDCARCRRVLEIRHEGGPRP